MVQIYLIGIIWYLIPSEVSDSNVIYKNWLVFTYFFLENNTIIVRCWINDLYNYEYIDSLILSESSDNTVHNTFWKRILR